jgi:hypothetical protein
MLVRCIAAQWTLDDDPTLRRVYEGDFDEEYIKGLNLRGYSIYYLPNYPENYNPGVTVAGHHIDTFGWVYVDMDLKEGIWPTKETFIESLSNFSLEPTRIVDSGNGIHVYWKISDLDGMSFLRIQRRLCRALKTDEAVSKIYQLMRLPGYVNVKKIENLVICQTLFETENVYTCEQLDRALPIISASDESYCQEHFNKTFNPELHNIKVDDKIPLKFNQLVADNKEAAEIWAGTTGRDRSTRDYRLGHIMLASGFTREEALSVLVNSAKALKRGPAHRISYATGIVDQVWVAEKTGDFKSLSSSVSSLLSRGEETLKGTRLYGHKYLDNTDAGLRLGQVVGFIAGAGVGKTAMALNAFHGFVQNNFEYTHLFISLEQPEREIALRWKALCGDNETLHNKVEILGNYNEDGSFRNLSLKEIRKYIIDFQKSTGRKIGCVTIDHIGIIDKNNRNGDGEGLIEICRKLKPLALETNTLVFILSQAPREKAGSGDIDLDKDAAYGTSQFEWYCDYIITMHQPLKRMYSQNAPTITSYKFCKIRHKNASKDVIQEDVRYNLFFDPTTQLLSPLTQDQERAFNYFYQKAINERKKDKKTEAIPYVSMRWDNEQGKTSSNTNIRAT